jgi:hypothetical protein
MDDLLVGLEGFERYLAGAGHRVTREAGGLAVSLTVGGRYHRLDVIWDRTPGVAELTVTLADRPIPAARRVEIGGLLTELNTELALPGFYLGESFVLFRSHLVRNHDDSVAPRAVDLLVGNAVAEIERHTSRLVEILGG